MPEKQTILVVEDTISDLVFLKQILEQAGYVVRYAETGAEALSSLNSHLPDLVILDILLPDIDGFEVCKRIRSNPRYLTLPVLFFSAVQNIDEKLLGLEMGASDFLPKTSETRELLARIRNLLIVKKKLDTLISASFLDPVTGTQNLQFFYYRLHQECLRSKRHDRVFSCALVDVDNFQAVSSQFTADTGDALLQQLGQILRSTLRGADEVCHFENDAFALLLPETDHRQAFTALERVRHSVADAAIPDLSTSRPVTVSCGVAAFAVDMENDNAVVDRARIALQQAKLSGRNQTRFFTEEIGKDFLGYSGG